MINIPLVIKEDIKRYIFRHICKNSYFIYEYDLCDTILCVIHKNI